MAIFRKHLIVYHILINISPFMEKTFTSISFCLCQIVVCCVLWQNLFLEMLLIDRLQIFRKVNITSDVIYVTSGICIANLRYNGRFLFLKTTYINAALHMLEKEL